MSLQHIPAEMLSFLRRVLTFGCAATLLGWLFVGCSYVGGLYAHAIQDQQDSTGAAARGLVESFERGEFANLVYAVLFLTAVVAFAAWFVRRAERQAAALDAAPVK